MVRDQEPQDLAGDEPDRPAPARATGDVTLILSRIEQGEPQAAEQLLPLVYEELRRLAAMTMAGESPDHTLQATALVHEAYLRLVDGDDPQHWHGRYHFFAAAGEAMRRILVDRARQKASLKRGGDRQRVDLEDVNPATDGDDENVLALHEALDKLERQDRVKADVVKLRFFAGFTIAETAQALGISHATVEKYWSYAKCWLRVELAGDTPCDADD